MSDINELYTKISEQAFRWNHARSNGMMVNQETERLKNIVINNINNIVEALKYAAEASEKMAILEAELDAADEELKELDDKIKELQNAAASKPAAKGKTKAKAEPVDVTDLPDGKF